VSGVKDKNIGLQKKVRSEGFNAVNEKFKLISDWDEPLVQSIRSESDKRYFEYMIRKDMIKEAEKVMQS
jgi:adenylyl- and sulfurtransferase ThiI